MPYRGLGKLGYITLSRPIISDAESDGIQEQLSRK